MSFQSSSYGHVGSSQGTSAMSRRGFFRRGWAKIGHFGTFLGPNKMYEKPTSHATAKSVMVSTRALPTPLTKSTIAIPLSGTVTMRDFPFASATSQSPMSPISAFNPSANLLRAAGIRRLSTAVGGIDTTRPKVSRADFLLVTERILTTVVKSDNTTRPKMRRTGFVLHCLISPRRMKYRNGMRLSQH